MPAESEDNILFFYLFMQEQRRSNHLFVKKIIKNTGRKEETTNLTLKQSGANFHEQQVMKQASWFTIEMLHFCHFKAATKSFSPQTAYNISKLLLIRILSKERCIVG